MWGELCGLNSATALYYAGEIAWHDWTSVVTLYIVPGNRVSNSADALKMVPVIRTSYSAGALDSAGILGWPDQWSGSGVMLLLPHFGPFFFSVARRHSRE